MSYNNFEMNRCEIYLNAVGGESNLIPRSAKAEQVASRSSHSKYTTTSESGATDATR
jgi:hypothetical protein